MTEEPIQQEGVDPTGQAITKVRMDPRQQGMAPMSFLAFSREEPCLCDVFLPVVDPKTKAVTMKLVCAKGEVFKPNLWDHFAKAGLRSVCVHNNDVAVLLEAMKKRAQELMSDSTAPASEKAAVIKEMASMTVRVLFSATERDPKNTEAACGLAKRTVAMFLQEEGVLGNLAQVLVSSASLYDHSINVSLMSMVLGRRLGLDKGRLQSLGMGALLHDLGMAQISPEILNKTSELTKEEKVEIERHPRLGHQALSLAKNMPYDALNIVLNHHERYDGKGYPTGLAGSNIPMLARLVRVVDVYDAMTSPRPYREALAPTEAAVTLLNEAGSNLDHDMAVEFIRMHREAFR
jgi:HD-GYP domain-containing protein (c-di-GMP phosphodiesterase class II)